MKCGSDPIDVSVYSDGSIVLFTPLTEAARTWIEANVSEEQTWFGSALAVEARFAPDLAHGMTQDGLALGACY